MLYLLRTGCQWRALPSDFPKWRTVHSYFAIWSEPREGGSLLEQAFVKNPDITVGKLVAGAGAGVSSFVRFEVGEGIAVEKVDFAEEVAAQLKPKG